MKIGIITYHFARNYGAILQCYALQTKLLSMGHDVWVLNYKSERQEKNNSLHHKRDGIVANLAVNAALLPFEAARKTKERRFAQYESRELRLTPRFRSVDEMQEYVNSEGFDLLISGSDQVFNPRIADFDCAFLFPFETSARKGSFAASLGSATEEDLGCHAEKLREFDVLSVREKTDAPTVQLVCGRSPHVVDDPVFLLDSSAWAAASGIEMRDDGYVLGYFINKEMSKHYLELTELVAKKLGLPFKVLNVRYGLDSFRPQMITDAGPEEFLDCFSRASFVCTDSFHGTAFSLIFKKRFISFEPKAKSHDWRKRDLLEKTGETMRSVAIDNDDARAGVERLCACPALDAMEGLATIRERQIAFLNMMLGE